jgi:hypothetical protein
LFERISESQADENKLPEKDLDDTDFLKPEYSVYPDFLKPPSWR